MTRASCRFNLAFIAVALVALPATLAAQGRTETATVAAVE